MNKNNIFTTNLCGKKVYKVRPYGEKVLLGTVIADYAFETEEVKTNFFVHRDDIFFIKIHNNYEGWDVIKDEKAQNIFDIKKIPYDRYTHAWFMTKKSFFKDGFTLDDGMVMNNE